VLCVYHFAGRARCFDVVTVQQKGRDRFSSPRQVIVPRANFTCSGRITGITASMNRVLNGMSCPYLEVWHPRTPGIGIFDKVGKVQLIESEVVQVGYDFSTAYWLVNLTLKDDDRIEFESGDVLGYYQPPNSRYQLWSIRTTGYIAYANMISAPVNLSNATSYALSNNRQPLVQFIVGMYV